MCIGLARCFHHSYWESHIFINVYCRLEKAKSSNVCIGLEPKRSNVLGKVISSFPPPPSTSSLLLRPFPSSPPRPPPSSLLLRPPLPFIVCKVVTVWSTCGKLTENKKNSINHWLLFVFSGREHAKTTIKHSCFVVFMFSGNSWALGPPPWARPPGPGVSRKHENKKTNDL